MFDSVVEDVKVPGKNGKAGVPASRSLLVLSMLAKVPQATVKDISAMTDIPVSSVYRLLTTLVSSGFVQKTSARHYGAGPIAVQLAERYRDTTLTTGSVTPYLRQLALDSGELAAFMVVHGTEAVCVETAESRHTLRCSYTVGASRPLLRGASATALLSRMPAESRHAVYDHYAINEEERAEIERARYQALEQGYAVSEGELDEGIWGASAPVTDGTGKLLGVVTLMAPVERSSHRGTQLTKLLRRTAGALSGGIR